ncbi:hypothetical protein EBI_26435 [Enterocytozoon bieneusi H348]|nr:hypothetical protein EBI_26435 [Enterocytozoon bieneusi H348]|eukprot:XP_001827741.1 hypothetical protein EBI_26435 [Enterocytozoon bieneusi H348]
MDLSQHDNDNIINQITSKLITWMKNTEAEKQIEIEIQKLLSQTKSHDEIVNELLVMFDNLVPNDIKQQLYREITEYI